MSSTRELDPIDSSEDTVCKRMREDDAEYSPSSDHEEEDNEDKLKSHDSNDNSTGYNIDIYGHSQQYYIHQKKYVVFLQELLSDTIRFPSFPKDTDGKVIIDTHPDYSPPSKDEVIGGNKCRETYGNFASPLQKRDPICYKNGDASSFTFEQMVKSLKLIDPRYSLHTINHSDDILPSQVPFKDENGNNFCTKINLLNKYTSEEKLMEYELRVLVIKWVLIDAHHSGYDKYIALFYGKHPQAYWSQLFEDAYEMAMSHYNEEQGTKKFIDLSFVNITRVVYRFGISV